LNSIKKNVNGESSRSHIELKCLAQRNTTNSTNNDRRSFSVIVNSSHLGNNKNAQSSKSLYSSKNALNSVTQTKKTNLNGNISKSAVNVNQHGQSSVEQKN
jgi:hypothetical protein